MMELNTSDPVFQDEFAAGFRQASRDLHEIFEDALVAVDCGDVSLLDAHDAVIEWLHGALKSSSSDSAFDLGRVEGIMSLMIRLAWDRYRQLGDEVEVLH